jgi:hypothetical protein
VDAHSPPRDRQALGPAASSEATSPARRRPAASTARSRRSRPELVPPWLSRVRRWDGDEFYGRIVVVDLVQALEGVMLPKLRKILPKGALWKGDFDKAYNSRGEGACSSPTATGGSS